MSACNCCAEPPVLVAFLIEKGYGSYKDDSKTEAEVVAEALSIIGSASYTDTTTIAWPLTLLAAQFYWDHTYGGAGGFKGRFKLQHQPTPSCYLKIWIREIYTPIEESGGIIEPTGPSTTTDLTPYEWVGAGPICLTDTTKAVDDPLNTIETEWYEVPCPAVYAQKDILLKCSYIPGYEPAWP